MSHSPEAARISERLAGLRVMVVGDVMLDRYWIGDVERISPESPVPVVEVRDSSSRLGGAANVAANVVAIGARCHLVSILGDDEAGRLVCEHLASAGIDSRVSRSAGLRTTEKLRIVSRNQQLLRVDFESRPDHEVLAQALEAVLGLIAEVDLLLLSDYGKGGLDHIAAIIAAAREQSRFVVVDPKGADYSRYHGASLVTPNLKEFQQAGGDPGSEESMRTSAQAMVERHNLGGLLVTRSDRGMTYYGSDGQVVHSPARAREVYDVSGAGDTVAAVVGAGLAAGLGLTETLDLANRAAGQVVAKFGTAVVELDRLLAEETTEKSS